MGTCSTSENSQEIDLELTKSKNNKCEVKLREDHTEDVATHKLLLLGTGDSGKSTLFKQMIQIYGKSYSEQDKKAYIPIICRNVVDWMEELARQSILLSKKDSAFADCRVHSSVQKSLDFIIDTRYESGAITEFAKHVKTLWADPGIQNTYLHRSNFHLPDSAEYFLKKVDELAQSNYLPTEEDIVRCRIRTTGIIETEFVIDRNRFKLLDVGGQRNERKKWVHSFDGVTAVMYVVDISSYDCPLYEDEKVNRLEEALRLFEEMCNSRWFRDICLILFFNKSDLFREKIAKYPLRNLFPDYTGTDDYDSATTFLEQEFLKRNHYKKQIYCHFTCATDTRLVSVVFNAVKDIVVREALQKAGLV